MAYDKAIRIMGQNNLSYDQAKYFRRRQFVLGPEYIDYEGWKRIRIEDSLLLTVHPDLPVSVVEEGENKAVLLGYAIDPFYPELDDEGILQRFVKGRISLDSVIAGLENLGGRFALVIFCKKGHWLFPDACALRQVNYCVDDHGAIWCASQAEVLAERLGYDYDPEMLSFKSMFDICLDPDELWLINGRTPYKEVAYLLANHYLDLLSSNVHRFWPVPGSINSLSVIESIRLLTPILKNSIEAAARRFDLKMGISAGSDSRRSLAATKEFKEKIFFYTHSPQPFNKADWLIPARLLPQLGIEHHQIELEPMSPEFRHFYERSATWARKKRGHIAHTELKYLGEKATVLNSNISEIPQRYYWLPKNKVNGEGLAALTRLYHPLAIKEFQKWITDAKPSCDASKMDILVLFDIELRSRWVAAAFAEYDIANETCCPYNNRRFLSLELSIDERQRWSRRKDVLIKHIKYMWPEVLIEPINPPGSLSELMHNFVWKNIVHKTITPLFPIQDYLRYYKMKRLFNRWKKTAIQVKTNDDKN